LESSSTAVPGAIGSGEGLVEAQRLPWRERASERTLVRDGRRWTKWTIMVVIGFGAPAATVLALDLWLFPVAILLSAHGYLICRLQAGRAVTSVMPLGARRSSTGPAEDRSPSDPESVAIGLLGDLLDHRERELLLDTGLAMQRGRLGVWLLGERGALLVRPGGRRIFSFCVRVGESDDLPGGDRVAHLLLALREDEEGFATVANLGFSGALRRCRRRMKPEQRPALEAAVSEARRQVRATAAAHAGAHAAA
jgi:hypothetical protein